MIPNYLFTLQSTVNEIKNISPNTSSVFIFKKDGEIIAQDETTQPKTIRDSIKIFNEMTKRMDAVGGIENLIIKGSNSQICFTPCTNDLYLVTVSSKTAEEKTVYAINRVLVPTIIKLLSQLGEKNEALLTFEKPQSEKIKESKKAETVSQAVQAPKEAQPEIIVDAEPYLPEPPVHQLMVEKLGGLLAPSDTVRIDSEVLAGWSELYEGKVIEKVNIETLKLKSTQCKFKPIKETKNPTKGIIQVPDKIMLTLEVSKGELVMVKPVID
jgi:hypothetical protein